MIYVASLIGILLFRQNRLLKNFKFILVLFILIIIAAGHITLNAQITTVFSDNFNRASLTPGGTPSMTYSTVVTAGDGGASINGSNFLQITNDNSGAANALGMTFITGPLSTYASPFINTLASNDGVIEWTFNMRYGRTTAPSGFDGGNYGRTIKLIEKDWAQGYNEIWIDRRDIKATGVLYYSFEGGSFTASKKMVILE